MIFSRQEKASITLGIPSLFTLVQTPVNLKLKTHQVSQIWNLAPANIKNVISSKVQERNQKMERRKPSM